jgi:hypothetical protein
LSKVLVTLKFYSSLVTRYKVDLYYKRVLYILGVNKLTLVTLKDKTSVYFVIYARLIYYTTLKDLY